MMPTITKFNSGVRQGLIVEVPDDSKKHQIFEDGGYITYQVGSGTDAFDILRTDKLPHSNYSIVGLAKEITEEQWRELVEEITTRCEVTVRAAGYIDLLGYRNYSEPYENQFGATFLTAKESGHSLIEAATGYYVVNPLGKKPKRYAPFMGAGHYTQNQLDEIGEYQNQLSAWQEAQSKVRNFIILIDNS